MSDIIKRGRLHGHSTSAAEFISFNDDWEFHPRILIDKVHTIMLAEQDIIQTDHANEILDILTSLETKDLETLEFQSDVHTTIETEIINQLGEHIGGQLHTARSRNDKTATAIRIYLRDKLLELKKELLEFNEVLINKATHTRLDYVWIYAYAKCATYNIRSLFA